MIASTLLRLLVAAAVSVSALAAMPPPAEAQFFFDPFRPRYRPPPPQYYPREALPRVVQPAPERSGGTIYSSSELADRFRQTQAEYYVLVFGDSLADQLAQGLADAFFEEQPEIAIVKKTRGSSGLVRADFYDWPAQVPSLLENEKVNAIIVMLGTNDRQTLRDEAGQHEFRSDRWRELYAQRVDAMINAVKARGVPIILVGQPSMMNPRLHADLPYVNEILRERAQALGVWYVDVWDGFVNESDAFVTMGPALDGQIRRLRMADGVHFTRVGARKLAHYVERDLIKLFEARGSQPVIPLDAPEPAPTGRPVAGPVLPLTQPAGPVGQLAGGEAKPGANDPTARRVLVEGAPAEPVAGRADDFRWPREQVKIAPYEPPAGQKLAQPAEPAMQQPAASAEKPAAPNGSTPLPTVITPSRNGTQIITVPEAQRGR
ncbi:MAG: DUF459 domain-containing protein [Bradyrhizobiaceae bacterium]|nr:DUF459 domain-containing protein [Bradyrhizobiaceae bacterium]